MAIRFSQGRAKIYALLCLLLLSVFMRVEVTRLTEIKQPLLADARDYVIYSYNLVEFGIYSRDGRGITEGSQPAPVGARQARHGSQHPVGCM